MSQTTPRQSALAIAPRPDRQFARALLVGLDQEPALTMNARRAPPRRQAIAT
jgi:hypothetical protein